MAARTLAPDLWRRFTIALQRMVAKTLGIPASRLGEVATVQYDRVAEYQLRGVVHFHALVRLDGPKTPDGFAAAPRAIDASVLADLVARAARSVRLTVPGVDREDPDRLLAFGRQFDARPVRTSRRTDDAGRGLSPEQVASYLAKYATKSATDTGATDNPQCQRLRAIARQLATRAAQAADQAGGGEAGPYRLLGKWVHMLGFRGHFASKSRRYSITLSAPRRARRRAQVLIAEARDTGRPSTWPPSRPTCSPVTTPTPPSSSATGPTQAPAGPPKASACSPTPPPPAPASATSGRQSSEGQRRTREKGPGDEEGICRADPDGRPVQDADLVGGGAAAGSGPVNPVQVAR